MVLAWSQWTTFKTFKQFNPPKREGLERMERLERRRFINRHTWPTGSIAEFGLIARLALEESLERVGQPLFAVLGFLRGFVAAVRVVAPG